MAGEPDPKDGKRIVDASAMRSVRLSGQSCASCHRAPSNAHHVVPKGAPYFGDDVYENLLMVCGSGTSGCHGALHGSPYTDTRGRRWTEHEVRRALGETISGRPDIVGYVLGKMGEGAGRDYLRRRYFIDGPLPAA